MLKNTKAKDDNTDKLKPVTFFKDLTDDDLLKIHNLGQLNAICEYLTIESMSTPYTADSIFEETQMDMI